MLKILPFKTLPIRWHDEIVREILFAVIRTLNLLYDRCSVDFFSFENVQAHENVKAMDEPGLEPEIFGFPRSRWLVYISPLH